MGEQTAARAPKAPASPSDEVMIEIIDMHKWFGEFHVLQGIDLTVKKKERIVICGPSGSGKSTLIRCINRLEEHQRGKITVDGTELTNNIRNIEKIRAEVGMVFQQPNPLPMSVFKNIAFPLRLAQVKDKSFIREKVESTLRQAGLWGEVKDRLNEDGRLLSGGQQQRLCLARALVLDPEVLLLDEPTSSLDPEAGSAIEELLLSLKQQCTLIMVSHYQDQIQRISDLQVKVSNGRFRI